MRARDVLTGHTNAAAEGINRLIKLLYRTACGFTNVTNPDPPAQNGYKP
jgi:transposase